MELCKTRRSQLPRHPAPRPWFVKHVSLTEVGVAARQEKLLYDECRAQSEDYWLLIARVRATLRPGQSGTFVLKSTGGFEQVEWSPCSVGSIPAKYCFIWYLLKLMNPLLLGNCDSQFLYWGIYLTLLMRPFRMCLGCLRSRRISRRAGRVEDLDVRHQHLVVDVGTEVLRVEHDVATCAALLTANMLEGAWFQMFQFFSCLTYRLDFHCKGTTWLLVFRSSWIYRKIVEITIFPSSKTCEHCKVSNWIVLTAMVLVDSEWNLAPENKIPLQMYQTSNQASFLGLAVATFTCIILKMVH